MLELELSPCTPNRCIFRQTSQAIDHSVHMWVCVWVGSVQAEQPELSRNSWSSKISLESANDCKIYSTPRARTHARAVSESVKEQKTHTLSRISPAVITAVFMRVCMCKCGYVTWAGVRCRSWWSPLRSVPPASACTSWTDHGSHPSGPAPRQMAGAIKATGEKITVSS